MPQWIMFNKGAAGKQSDKQPVSVEYPGYEVIDALSNDAKAKLIKTISQSIARNRHKYMLEPYETTMKYLEGAKNTAKRFGVQFTDEMLRSEVEAKLAEDEDRRFNETPESKRAGFKRQTAQWEPPVGITVTGEDILEYLEEEESKQEAANAASDAADSSVAGGASEVINPDEVSEPRKGRRKGNK